MDAMPRIIKIGDALSQLINVTLQPGESLTTTGWIIPALSELQVVKSFTADSLTTKVFVLERA